MADDPLVEEKKEKSVTADPSLEKGNVNSKWMLPNDWLSANRDDVIQDQKNSCENNSLQNLSRTCRRDSLI